MISVPTRLLSGSDTGLDRIENHCHRSPAPHSSGYITGNEFTIFGGESVVNASLSGHGLAGAAEYRRGLAHHIDGTISYIYEGDPRLVRRSGVSVQIWPVNTFYEKRVSVGIGLGGY